MKRVAILAIVAVVAISLLTSLGYGPVLFGFVNRIPGRDTTGHFVLMGALCFLVNLGFARADRHGTPVAVLRCTAWILVAVTLEEAVQAFIPIRSFSWLDLFSSYAGIGLGGLAAALLLSWMGRRPTD